MSIFKKRPKLYIDARHYDPCHAVKDEVWIMLAQNEEDSIYERVSSALRSAGGVVLIDQGSTDSTPYLAAEAGAVVMLLEANQPADFAVLEAIQLAGQMARSVRIIDD